MVCRQCGIGNRVRNVIGFVIVLVGTLMLISGLCILAMSALRQ